MWPKRWRRSSWQASERQPHAGRAQHDCARADRRRSATRPRPESTLILTPHRALTTAQRRIRLSMRTALNSADFPSGGPGGSAVPDAARRAAANLRQSGPRRRFPRSGGDPRARRLLLCLCNPNPARRAVDQYPGGPVRQPCGLGASRRCSSGKAGVGARRRRISGRRASSTTVRPTSCIIRPLRTCSTGPSGATASPSPRRTRRPGHSSTSAGRS